MYVKVICLGFNVILINISMTGYYSLTYHYKRARMWHLSVGQLLTAKLWRLRRVQSPGFQALFASRKGASKFNQGQLRRTTRRLLWRILVLEAESWWWTKVQQLEERRRTNGRLGSQCLQWSYIAPDSHRQNIDRKQALVPSDDNDCNPARAARSNHTGNHTQEHQQLITSLYF